MTARTAATSTATVAATGSRRRARVAAAVRRHPELPLLAPAVLAAAYLVAGAVDPAGHAGHAASGVHAAGPAAASATHAVAMVTAMMLPTVAPLARLAALRSVWPRRHRAAALVAVGHLAVWVAAVVPAALVVPLLLAVEPAVPGVTTARAAAGLLVVAAAWQVAPVRRRLLRRCGSVRLRAATGAAADRDCVVLGMRAGLLCVAACGPAMLPMLVPLPAAAHLLLMVVVAAVLWWERAEGPNPAERPGSVGQAAALLALGAAVLVLG